VVYNLAINIKKAGMHKCLILKKLFEEVVSKAKTVADTTGKRTGEMVELGKLKYKAKQISWEIERTYAKLGVIVYESKKTGGDFSTVIAAAVEELDKLNVDLDRLEEKIRDFKKTERYRPSRDADETVVDFEEIKPDDSQS